MGEGEGEGETLGNIEGGEEDCFEHFMDLWSFTCLEGSVTGVVIHMVVME